MPGSHSSHYYKRPSPPIEEGGRSKTVTAVLTTFLDRHNLAPSVGKTSSQLQVT
ncbi:hypothetical protein ACLOJK_009670 [Asimina triloba]